MPVILHKDGSIKHALYSHMYGNGLKMMEHSYVGNVFVLAVENELLDCPQRLVWAGDYSDSAFTDEFGQEDNLYNASELAIKRVAESISDHFRSHENRRDFNSFIFPLAKNAKYALNHTTKEFVRIPEFDESKLQIHPLPLLTTDSQQGAGGDYHGEDPRGIIGKWSGDVISVTNEEPAAEFLEFVFDLSED